MKHFMYQQKDPHSFNLFLRKTFFKIIILKFLIRKRYSGKSFKDSLVIMKKPKLSFKEKRKK